MKKSSLRRKGGVRQPQLANRDVLGRILHVCENRGLTAWLWSGSLLGAVRNEAFLHADRHVFLLMPRAD